MLEVLVAAEGGVVSAEELLERAWDENADPFTNAVRITVSALRKRLGEPWLIAHGARRRLPDRHRHPAQGDEASRPWIDAPGLSVRLKLTLSYAGSSCVAGAPAARGGVGVPAALRARRAIAESPRTARGASQRRSFPAAPTSCARFAPEGGRRAGLPAGVRPRWAGGSSPAGCSPR